MATWLKQSTAVEIKLGPFVDSTDGFTAESGLTIAQADVRLAKNGGDWAQKSETTTLVHEENGWYRCLLDTTDTATLGLLIVAVNETGALPVWREFMVVAAAVYDSLIGGGDTLPADLTQINGAAQTATLDDIETLVDDLETRLTAVRAGYLDNLSAGAVALQATLADATFGLAALETLVDELESRLTAGRAANLDNLDVLLSSRATPAQVNTEVVDALNVDTYAEPGQAAPPATATLTQKIGYLFKAWRNRFTQDASNYKLYGDDALTVDQKAAVSDDATTFDRGEVATGP